VPEVAVGRLASFGSGGNSLSLTRWGSVPRDGASAGRGSLDTDALGSPCAQALYERSPGGSFLSLLLPLRAKEKPLLPLEADCRGCWVLSTSSGKLISSRVARSRKLKLRLGKSALGSDGGATCAAGSRARGAGAL
jgi:hypothetical protein